MALPQIPLNGRCAGDNRRSTHGPASTRSDCSGPNRGSQGHPQVTIGNLIRIHYRGNPDFRVLLRCGCVEASQCTQCAGIHKTRRTSGPEARPDSVERGHRFCFHVLRRDFRISSGASVPGFLARHSRNRRRGFRTLCGVCLLHPPDAVFRRHFLPARPQDFKVVNQSAATRAA